MESVYESLPPAPLADLLLRGVCPPCVLRFFKVRDPGLSQRILNPSELFHEVRPFLVRVLGEECLDNIQKKAGLEEGSNPVGDVSAQSICIVCLGILQFFVQDTNVPLISEVAKRIQLEGFTFDSFCLEVSLPAVTYLREHALWCYLSSQYSSEGVFTGADGTKHLLPLKESLKCLLIQPLEQLLNARFDVNSMFLVALNYKHIQSSTELAFLDEIQRSYVKINSPGKTFHNNGARKSSYSDFHEAKFEESLAFVCRSRASIPSELFVEHFPRLASKLDVPCVMEVRCLRRALYVGGRYLKFSRNISQSPWTIDDVRKGETSVQEIIGEKVLALYKAESYKFRAAGREDIDVRMLGNGRPFLLEVTNARAIPNESELTQVETSINDVGGEWVKVKGLQHVGSEAVDLMREGETEKKKEYAAVVWLSRPLLEADYEKLSSIKDLIIEQKTPLRVLHRRSPLTRPRIIHWMRCEKIPGRTQYFLLFLCSQAGTYIKEFVHGDFGRTYPNCWVDFNLFFRNW